MKWINAYIEQSFSSLLVNIELMRARETSDVMLWFFAFRCIQ